MMATDSDLTKWTVQRHKRQCKAEWMETGVVYTRAAGGIDYIKNISSDIPASVFVTFASQHTTHLFPLLLQCATFILCKLFRSSGSAGLVCFRAPESPWQCLGWAGSCSCWPDLSRSAWERQCPRQIHSCPSHLRLPCKCIEGWGYRVDPKQTIPLTGWLART